MKEIILAKYGEIALKGLNKNTFEDVLIKNIKRRLSDLEGVKYHSAQSTLYVETAPEDTDTALERLKKVFGIAKLCKAAVSEKDFEDISKVAILYAEDALSEAKTFKVDAKRADKHFPMTSPEIMRELGGRLLSSYPHLEVDVRNPDVTVTVEIREENAYIHAKKIDGAGGMPVGSSGRALLLLSGGLDSPVAGYMMAKRGVHISAIHFEAPPYTSERARMKVERLAVKMAEYCGMINFMCVPFTEIQEKIREHCPEELFTIIMRRIMMEVAQRLAVQKDLSALVTGESIAQVASQTMAAMVCTDAVCRMPVFRPCIGMDKIEIIEIARKIGTYDISIEPYEDCCTVFTPRHPKTKPVLADVEAAQALYDFEPLIQKSVEETKAYTLHAEK